MNAVKIYSNNPEIMRLEIIKEYLEEKLEECRYNLMEAVTSEGKDRSKFIVYNSDAFRLLDGFLFEEINQKLEKLKKTKYDVLGDK